MVKRALGYLFIVFIVFALMQCARRGSPTGGEKDVDPPKLVKAVPENMAINFKEKKIRLYFDEYIKLKDVQNQLIVSPPLKNTPLITPQGSASKYIEIIIKDTLKENTTYTFNFGQSIVDNNEGNPNSFLTYVFSTGDYIDSLSIAGVVKDAFNKKADPFISVMLYEMDSTYNDSTIYKKVPNYLTNTLDSTTIFHLNNLKAGKYALFALKDQSKNNLFDQNADKIGFLTDTISIPTDSIFLLNLFKEVPNYRISVPSFAATNKIIFGYQGMAENIDIKPLTQLPDTIRTMVSKERDKDTLNFWFTPFKIDSIVFAVTNEKLKTIDTFSVKTRKVAFDSLSLSPNQKGTLSFEDALYITANTPMVKIDTSKIKMMDKDSLAIPMKIGLDRMENRLNVAFEIAPNEKYNMRLYPGAVEDFFGIVNDTLSYGFSTPSYADLGNLTVKIAGAAIYPLIVQLTDEKGETVRELYATEPQPFEFNNLKPSNYLVRVIFDTNGNRKWDTGNYLKKIQPERISYYSKVIEMRANWESEETFILAK